MGHVGGPPGIVSRPQPRGMDRSCHCRAKRHRFAVQLAHLRFRARLDLCHRVRGGRGHDIAKSSGRARLSRNLESRHIARARANSAPGRTYTNQMSNSDLAPAQSRAKRHNIKHLELHVTHACNLACESCSHYSNHNHHGHLSLSDADRWMSAWSSRASVDEFHLLGGEPTIHPDLTDFVRLVRRHWPETIIRIRTNGFFLHRHSDLPELLAADRRVIVGLAVHHDSAEYRERLRATFDLIEHWRTEFANVVGVDQ